ncbi:MAG: hypothetical protein E7465_06880 [Ruminococcaceae bacterium]|nr:hypothetical protein [Oscillospiraceae bacterium]
MQAIINFFEGFSNVITSIFEFIVSFFSDLGWLVSSLQWALGVIPLFLNWIPGPMLTIITLTLTVVMIYKIMGREG